MSEPLVSQQVKSANKFLWAVKTYLDLITTDGQLVSGSGLKRLFAMSCGVATLNDRDIEAIAAKSERLNLIPHSLHNFMTGCILKNLELYGKNVASIINNRVMAIARGDVRNPDPQFKFSADEARRYFYVPPVTFMKRLSKALSDDTGLRDFPGIPPATTTLQDIANDADYLLTRMQINEGHLAPTQTSWGSMIACVERLIDILEAEARYPVPDRDYKIRARACVKILWFFGKLLMGDLSPKPLLKDINMIDLEVKLGISDGTLAAIPFPLKETIALFGDDDGRGLTMKGRTYLSAVAGASFHLRDDSED